jgi:hypothetical protein
MKKLTLGQIFHCWDTLDWPRYLIYVHSSDCELDQSELDLPSQAQAMLHDNVEYLRVLKEDVVASAQQLMTACQASGQQQEDLQATIQEGNRNGGWGDPPEQLLLDDGWTK